MIEAKLMTQVEMYDCYMRNATIYAPHMNGEGMNAEKGIRRHPLNRAHSQAEEQTMAGDRGTMLRGTGRGGFSEGKLHSCEVVCSSRELPLWWNLQVMVH
jgi:hypothetical protein